MFKLKLKDEFVDADLLVGPMPNFNETFEKFFIQKAFCLIFESQSEQDKEEKYVVSKICF